MNRDEIIDLQLGWNLLFKLSLPYSTGSRQREIRDGWKQAPTIFFFLPKSVAPLRHKALPLSLSLSLPGRPFIYFAWIYGSARFHPKNLRANDRPVPNKKKGKEDSAFVSNRRPIDLFRMGGKKKNLLLISLHESRPRHSSREGAYGKTPEFLYYLKI